MTISPYRALLLAFSLAFLPLFARSQAVPTPRPHQNFVDNAGNPCAGCSLYSYLAGTTTPTPTYTDNTKTSQHTNPIILGADSGSNIWLDPAVIYKFVLVENGTTQWTVDQVPGLAGTGIFLLLSGGNLTGVLGMGSPVTVSYNVSTSAQLTTALTNCSTLTCSILITGNIAISSNLTIPSYVSLIFAGGQLQPNSGITLTILGPIADTYQQIFGGSGTIAGLQKDRPEWFGTTHIGPPIAALDQTNGGDVLLRLGTYISDFGNNPVGSTTYICMNTPRVRLLGSGRPGYNSGFTAMTGGTIIDGTLNLCADYPTVKDLGVDMGSAYSATADNALVISNTLNNATGVTPLRAPLVDNVACLGNSASAAYHCMLVQTVQHAFLNNILAVFNLHGIAFKGINSVIQNVRTEGHASDGLIMASNSYAVTQDDQISNLNCNQVNSQDSGGCLVIDVESGTYAGGAISHINVNGVVANNIYNSPAIALTGQSVPNNVSDINITNVSVDTEGTALGTGSSGVSLNGAGNNINLSQGVTNNVGYGIFMGSDMNDVTISNWSVTGALSQGYLLRGSTTQIINVTARSPANYCYDIVAGVVYGMDLNCFTPGAGIYNISGGTFSSLPILSQPFGAGPDYASVGSGFGLNWNTNGGSVYKNTAFGYDWSHPFESTTPASDYACFQVFNPSSNGVGQTPFCALTIDGTGTVYFGQNVAATSGDVAPVQTLVGTLLAGGAVQAPLGASASTNNSADPTFTFVGTNSTNNAYGIAFYGEGPQWNVWASGLSGITTLGSATSNTLCYNTALKSGFDVFSTCSSLRKYKAHIRPIMQGTSFQNALAEVMELNPIRYRSRTDGREEIGFIAEDVEKVDPRNSTYGRDGKLVGVQYDHMVALLTKAIQEQQKQINDLRKQIQERP